MFIILCQLHQYFLVCQFLLLQVRGAWPITAFEDDVAAAGLLYCHTGCPWWCDYLLCPGAEKVEGHVCYIDHRSPPSQDIHAQ